MISIFGNQAVFFSGGQNVSGTHLLTESPDPVINFSALKHFREGVKFDVN